MTIGEDYWIVDALRQPNGLTQRQRERLAETVIDVANKVSRQFFDETGLRGDAAGEICMRCWQNLDTFKGSSKFRTWCWSLATNVCRQMKRTPEGQGRFLSLDTSTEPIGSAGASNYIGDDLVALTIFQQMVRRAVRDLPNDMRNVVELQEFDDWSLQAVADNLGVALARVKLLRNRALDVLRYKLADLIDPTERRFRDEADSKELE
jgi:RNA polymerase sigma factor (sigma-70 family)